MIGISFRDLSPVSFGITVRYHSSCERGSVIEKKRARSRRNGLFVDSLLPNYHGFFIIHRMTRKNSTASTLSV